MRVVSIGLGAFAIGMLMAVSIFAKDPETKSDKSSQATPTAQAQKPRRVRVKEDVQKAAGSRGLPYVPACFCQAHGWHCRSSRDHWSERRCPERPLCFWAGKFDKIRERRGAAMAI
jgi:hypothetical protein